MPEILTLNGQMLVSPNGEPLLAPPSETVTAGIIFNEVNANGEPVVVTLRGNYIISRALQGCDKVTTVSIEDAPTIITPYAFNLCDAMTQIYIPSSVTGIGQSAFGGCTALTDIYFGGTSEQWGEIRISGDNTRLSSVTLHPNSSGLPTQGA